MRDWEGLSEEIAADSTTLNLPTPGVNFNNILQAALCAQIPKVQ